MSSAQFGPTAWLCHALKAPFPHLPKCWTPVTPATRLSRALRPQERHLNDLCAMNRVLSTSLQEQGQGYTGIWKKDKNKCDPMDAAFEAIQLPWLYRRAIGFLNYLEVEDTEKYFKTTLKAGGIMDVVEQYPWTGETVEHGRRDKRKGTHRGSLRRTPEGPQLQLQWEDPYGGQGIDTFALINDARTLVHTTSIKFEDEAKNCTYKTVYNRVQSR